MNFEQTNSLMQKKGEGEVDDKGEKLKRNFEVFWLFLGGKSEAFCFSILIELLAFSLDLTVFKLALIFSFNLL